jgi:DNA-binding transcriptional LysR family regulator
VPRRQIAITKASVTSWAVIAALIDQPTTRRENRSITQRRRAKLLDLAKGEADIAIRGVPSTDGGLVGRKIADLPWAVYASSSYIERRGRITCFEDINNHSVIQFDGQLQTHQAARWLKLVAPNAQVAARSVCLPSLLLGVKSGVGLAPLPVIVGDGDEDLVSMLGTIPELFTPFYLFMHEDMKQTPRVRAFFDFVIDELEALRVILAGKSRQ